MIVHSVFVVGCDSTVLWFAPIHGKRNHFKVHNLTTNARVPTRGLSRPKLVITRIIIPVGLNFLINLCTVWNWYDVFQFV